MEQDSEGGQAAAASFSSAVDPKEEEDYSEVMNDAEFLQSVLEDLPGVNPEDAAVKEAVKQLTKASDDKKADEKKKDGKKEDKK